MRTKSERDSALSAPDAPAQRTLNPSVVSHTAPPPQTSTMMKHTLSSSLLALVAVLTSLPVHAHEGHGLPGVAHWHSTDVLGFIAAAVAVGALVWFKGRK